ncbi:MAG: phenylalanine--tRNA ligase subunit beta, partial [Patescibacteria group bacterium]
DLLSHQGIAREVASLLDIPFNDPTLKYKIPESKPAKLKIDIQTDKCKRYMGRIVRNVKMGPSPEWVVGHLASIGQRSINNVVDAANLTMFDTGQPIHCFDLDKLTEEGLIVREAREGEEMTTLDNKQIKLNPTDLVIADSKKVLGLAGVKGGKIAEVDANTKNIIIEVANFDPASTRKSARRHGLLTDAAKRFENEPSPELCEYAMREVSGLFVEYGTGEFEDIVDVYPEKPKVRTVSFFIERISGILGEKISEKEVKNILERYSMDYEEKGGDFLVTIPSHRLDISMPEDMAEEIGRVLGYDKVKSKIPKINFKPRANEQYKKIQKAREDLLLRGYSEVMTYAFREKGKVEVMESASDKKALRSDLSSGLSESLKLNKLNSPLLGLKEVKIFEIGTVWNPKEEIYVAYNEKDKIVEKNLDEY